MRGIFFLIFLFGFAPPQLFAQDQVFYNANIFTANKDHPFAEAIAIRGKQIIGVGALSDINKLVSSDALRMDCKGGFIMPGIVDSHIHAISGGEELIKANTGDEDISIYRLSQYGQSCLEKKEGLTGEVLVIYGINISLWAKMDSIVQVFNNGLFAQTAVVLSGSDGHTSWANKVMCAKAGIDARFIAGLSKEERQYYGISANGLPNGFVSESAVNKIMNALPQDTDFQAAAVKALEYCNQQGITAFLDPAIGRTEAKTNTYLDAYAWLQKTGRLAAHVTGAIVCNANADAGNEIKKVKSLQKQYNTDNLNIAGCKIFADGVVEHPTHTAALSKPYAGTDSKGVLMVDPVKLKQFAVQADQADLLVHIHAIGDAAVTVALDGLEAARKASGKYSIPHTITHLQFVQPADFDRFASLKVLASYQLLWAFGDVTTVDIVKPYVAPSIYQWQYPARSMLQAGATICGASDWPVSTANPFEAIYNAETRLGPLGVLDSTQCMPRLEMLYAYTIHSAKALRGEKKFGSLETGKSADLIMLDRDILTVSPEQFKKTKVLWTMFEGKKVFEKEGVMSNKE